MKDQHELESFVMERLNEIKAVPPRDAHMASRGRAQFLGRVVVSAQALPRQKGWITIFRKERYAMNVLLSILVVGGLLFGGGATAVGAAQDDLPNEPLYTLKTWTEDFSLQFQNNGEDKVNRLMQLSQIRVQEMTSLAEAGEPIPDQVRLRLEQHIQQALQTCLTLDDPTLDRTLLQIRDRLQDRDRDMDRLQLHTQSQDQLQLLTQTRTMLRDRLRLVDDGLLDSDLFRERVRNGFRFGQDDELTPPIQNGNGQQNGQPTQPHGGQNINPGGPNTNPGGPNTTPGGPNLNPGGPNPNPGGFTVTPSGPNTDPGGNSNDSGNGSNDNGSGGGGSNDNGSGGGGKP